MTYLSPSDFRGPSLAEFCVGLELTDDEVETTRLTATIERMSQRFDVATGDHFASETPITLTLRGDCTTRLELGRRTTDITSVNIVNYLGTSTLQASTVYRLHSSLDAAGAEVKTPGSIDYLEILPYQYLTGASFGLNYGWPDEPNSIVVVGTFGWTTTPADVKRAVALLVFNDIKEQADIMHRAQSFNDAGANYQLATGEFGIPAVDAIVKAYTYAASATSTGPQVFIG